MNTRAMKETGVPWIGAIPIRWDVVRLGQCSLSYCDGPFGSNLKSSHYAPHGVRVIRLQNVGAGVFVDDDAVYIEPEHFKGLERHAAQPGDLVVAGLGDDNHPVGRACIVPSNLGIAMVKADCFCFRLDSSQANAAFVCHYLSSPCAASEAAQATKGSTRTRINLSGAARIRIPLPPLDEQKRIAAFLDARTATIDAAIAEHERAIELLREYRQSLITAAVTGRVPMEEPTP